MLQAVKRAVSVDRENGQLHANIVDFVLLCKSFPQPMLGRLTASARANPHLVLGNPHPVLGPTLIWCWATHSQCLDDPHLVLGNPLYLGDPHLVLGNP